MRGCSLPTLRRLIRKPVDPAHAGMLLPAVVVRVNPGSGPRACGDAPRRVSSWHTAIQWTPRMRGCSCTVCQRQLCTRVDPAHAGMLPSFDEMAKKTVRGPRACGDAPREHQHREPQCLWTPRMRGCSSFVFLYNDL